MEKNSPKLKFLSFTQPSQINIKADSFEDLIRKQENENLNNSHISNTSIASLSFYEEDEEEQTAKVKSDRKNSCIQLLKINLLQTYKQINPDLKYDESKIPKRSLTNPEDGVSNNNKDNIESNLIVFIQDEINKYIIIDIIGQGVSGQVFQVQSKVDQKYYALKIIKNKKVYKNQALIELKILTTLNKKFGKENDSLHIIKVQDYFVYHQHLCIVLELLNENLYQILQHNLFQGISLNSISFIMRQILEGVEQIHGINIIHCDLKPENILLKIDKKDEHCSKGEVSVKVTDFGSACSQLNPMFSYIQSRYYRAPEIILGMPYTNAIDIWSIGLIAVELFLGTPLLPGTCEYDQLRRMIHSIGDIPKKMFYSKKMKNLDKYFKQDPTSSSGFVLKAEEEFYKEFNEGKIEKCEYSNDWSDITSLDDLVKVYKEKSKKVLNTNINKEKLNSSAFSTGTDDILINFIDFLKCMLNMDPDKRWSASDLLLHPFINKEKDIIIQTHGNQKYQENASFTNQMNEKKINKSYNQKNYCNNSILNSSNSCFQPNISNINMNWMNQFPFAKVEHCDLRDKAQSTKKNNKNNNTYTKISFEKINTNNSYIPNNNINNFSDAYQKNSPYTVKIEQIPDQILSPENPYSNIFNNNMLSQISSYMNTNILNQSNSNIYNNYASQNTSNINPNVNFLTPNSYFSHYRQNIFQEGSAQTAPFFNKNKNRNELIGRSFEYVNPQRGFSQRSNLQNNYRQNFTMNMNKSTSLFKNSNHKKRNVYNSESIVNEENSNYNITSFKNPSLFNPQIRRFDG